MNSVFSRGGAASRLVSCAYVALDLFAGREGDLLLWARSLTSEGSLSELIPRAFDVGSAAALRRALARAEVVDGSGVIDTVRLLQFRETVELLPHFRTQERHRVPIPKAQVVFTLPEGLHVPHADVYLGRSLAVRLSETLGSATSQPVLLASPFWSLAGTAILRPSLTKAVERRLPITLAGARAPADGEAYDHRAAMIAFATQLRADGADVTCLEYRPPFPTSLFHAKLACGRIGYLGSGNFTDHALGKHVEAGVPLQPVDVKRLWWLIDLLRREHLLIEIA